MKALTYEETILTLDRLAVLMKMPPSRQGRTIEDVVFRAWETPGLDAFLEVYEDGAEVVWVVWSLYGDAVETKVFTIAAPTIFGLKRVLQRINAHMSQSELAPRPTKEPTP